MSNTTQITGRKHTARLKLISAAALTAILAAACALPGPEANSAAAPSTSTNASAQTELLWLGQASFRIKTPGGKTLIVDPWISGGPKAPEPYKSDLKALGKVDAVFVTHAHVDHIGDAPAIAKLNNVIFMARPT